MLIPVQLFEMMPHWKEFEACGLTERRETHVYVKGSSERFSWLSERREAGRKGGLAKAKQNVTNASKRKQTLPSSSSSYSLDSNSENNSMTKQPDAERVRSAERVQLSADCVWSGITEEKTKRWAESYPALDVAAELKRMAGWAAANPKHKKKNWERFIVNWLSTAQDRAAGPRQAFFASTRDPPVPVPRKLTCCACARPLTTGHISTQAGDSCFDCANKRPDERRASH